MTFKKFVLACFIGVGIAVGSIVLLVVGVIVAGTLLSDQTVQSTATRPRPAASSSTSTAAAQTLTKPTTTQPVRREPKAGLNYANYLRIREGMTYPEVVKILGSSGKEISRSELVGITTVMYSWSKWSGANMNAMFQNGKLVTKAQFGLD